MPIRVKSPTLFDAFFLARLQHIVSEVRSLFEEMEYECLSRISYWSKTYLTNETFFLNFEGLKFIYSEKPSNFFKISTVDLFYIVTVNGNSQICVEISQNFVPSQNI